MIDGYTCLDYQRATLYSLMGTISFQISKSADDKKLCILEGDYYYVVLYCTSVLYSVVGSNRRAVQLLHTIMSHDLLLIRSTR